MDDDDKLSQPTQDDDAQTTSRRRFLQGTVATAGAMVLPQGGGAEAAAPDPRHGSHHGPPRRKRPNFLILMCDENRFPPVYESEQTKQYRATYLRTQNALRAHGVDFQRHYAASVACVPSRASIYTGQYPSLHGVTQTTGAAKRNDDPDVFWLDPSSVPTFGDYFRAAGYSTFWRGKWHGSDADMRIPGTDSQLLSYDPSTGAPNPASEALYQNADRLGGYGFSGWIGPEPHGSAPLNSGSSVPPGQQGRDIGFAQQAKSLIEQLDRSRSDDPWLIVSSFVNPHDITLWGFWVNSGKVPGFDFTVEPYVPFELFVSSMFQQTHNDDLTKKPSAQASYQQSYAQWMQPIFDDPVTLEQYYRYYYQLQKNVDDQMMTVYQALQQSRFRQDTIVIFTSDHGDLLGSHDNMHQKWYTAYDEAIRVPLIIHNRKLFPSARMEYSLTSHIDLLPTLLGLAGLDAESLRQQIAQDYSDALPLVGRDLAPLVRGEVASVDEPLYFMTDDDPSRGLNQVNWTGIAYDSVSQPNHIE